MNTKRNIAMAALGLLLASGCGTTATVATKNDSDMDNLTLTAEWDKVFPQSDKVTHSKVTFRQPLRHNACGRPLHTARRGGADGGHCRERSVRRG